MVIFVGTLAAQAGVRVQETREAGVLKQIVLENAVLRVRIIRKGGRVISLFDKTRNVELAVSGNAPFDGVCKTREWTWHNSETHSVNYALKVVGKSPEKATVEAVRNLKTAALAGCRLTKRYTLGAGVARLDVADIVQCLDERTSFQLNAHNLFSLKTFSDEGTVFYAPSKRGMVRFSSTEASRNRSNLVYDMAAPWMAAVAGDTGLGAAVLVRNLKSLDAMFAWAGTNSFTIEPIFSETALRPVAEADICEFAYSLIPLHGLSAVDYLSENLVYNVEKQDKNASLTAYFPVSLGEVSIKIMKDENCLSERILHAKAGSCVKIAFAPAEGKGPHTLVISGTGREIRSTFDIHPDGKRSFISPDTKIKKREVTGLNGYYYYYDDLWLSPDVWTYVTFGLKGDFSKKKNLRLALEVPSGVQVRHLGKVRYENELVKKNGETWAKHLFYAGRTKTYFSAVGMLLRTDRSLKGPVEARLTTAWDDGGLSPETTTIRAVSFPEKMPQLKRLRIGLSCRPSILRDWPDFAGDMRRTGVNFLELWDWPAATILTNHLGNGVYSDLVETMRAEGIDASMESSTPFESAHRVLSKKKFYYDGAQTLFHPERKANPFDVEEAKIVTLAGERMNNVCPSYRGPYYDKVLDMVKSVVDYGAPNIQYDEETYGQGAIICFCGRCKREFKDHLAQKHPDLAYIDPMVFEKTPGEYPRLDEAWWQFKTDQVAGVYQGIRNTLNEYADGKGKTMKIYVYVAASIGEGRYGAIRQRLTDYAKLAKHVDCLLPMVYTANAEMVGDIVAKTKTTVADEADAGVALAPNRSYELHRVAAQDFPSLETTRHQILEAFFAGGRLVHFWAPYATLKGAGSFREIAEAVRAMAPIEDVLLEGLIDKTVKSSNSEVRIRAFRDADQVAILASEYSDDLLSMIITCPVKRHSKVLDTHSGEIIAEITPESPRFTLKLDTNRARVLLIEP